MFKSLRDFQNPSSLRYKFRRARFLRLEAIINSVLESKGTCSIIDLGGSTLYWQLLKPEILKQCRIKIVNRASEDMRISDTDSRVLDSDIFEFLEGDACDLSGIADDEYDIAHSNSVIEHVGSIANIRCFVNETMRVGRLFYVQTPSLWFPIEPHYGVPFIHWLPIQTRAWMLNHFAIGFVKKESDLLAAFAKVEEINLLSESLLTKLFPSGSFYRERFCFLTKSVIITS
jgi:hypothetical protein